MVLLDYDDEVKRLADSNVLGVVAELVMLEVLARRDRQTLAKQIDYAEVQLFALDEVGEWVACWQGHKGIGDTGEDALLNLENEVESASKLI